MIKITPTRNICHPLCSKLAIVIKEHYNCEVIYIKRKVEHENTIRAELIQDEDLLNIADHVIENNGDLDNFFNKIDEFICNL